MRPDLLALAFVAGIGIGVALSALAVWVASRFIDGTLARPKSALPGLMVRDSTMGEFDAARRGA